MTDPGGAFAHPPAAHRAYCAVHLSSPATGTCSRCGSYVCAACTSGNDQLCAACRTRLGIDQFPFTRDAWDIGGLVSHSWDTFQRNVGPMILLTLAVFLIPMSLAFTIGIVGGLVGASVAPTARAGIALGGQLFQQLLFMVMSLGAVGVYLDAVRGRPLSFDSFMRGVRRTFGAILQYLVVFAGAVLMIAVPYAFFASKHDFGAAGAVSLAVMLILGIWLGMGLAFMQLELVHDPNCGPVEAVRRSWALVSGKRLVTFATLVVAGLLMLAGLFACGFGALVSYPIGMMVMTSLYLALRTGSDLPEVASRS